jgi:hypothetical protein
MEDPKVLEDANDAEGDFDREALAHDLRNHLPPPSASDWASNSSFDRFVTARSAASIRSSTLRRKSTGYLRDARAHVAALAQSLRLLINSWKVAAM